MGILESLFGTPVDRLKIKDIKTEEMRLQNHIEIARKDIQRLDKKKRDLFKQGVGADLIKKKMLSQEIKHIDTKSQMKIKQFMLMHKQYMFVSNLAVLKEFEKDLKQTPIWQKITNIEPGQFENSLIKITLKGKSFEEILNNLNNVFEMGLSDSSLEESMDETETQLMDAWSGVETGTIDVDDAQKMVSTEKQLETKDNEGT
jgi:hypothetical protein